MSVGMGLNAYFSFGLVTFIEGQVREISPSFYKGEDFYL